MYVFSSKIIHSGLQWTEGKQQETNFSLCFVHLMDSLNISTYVYQQNSSILLFFTWIKVMQCQKLTYCRTNCSSHLNIIKYALHQAFRRPIYAANSRKVVPRKSKIQITKYKIQEKVCHITHMSDF